MSEELNIEKAIITVDNYKDQLMLFGDFDFDANGSNGIACLEDGAIEGGYENNLEYWVSLSEDTFNSTIGSNTAKLKAAVETFIDRLESSWNYYCSYAGTDVTIVDTNKVYAMFAYSN